MILNVSKNKIGLRRERSGPTSSAQRGIDLGPEDFPAAHVLADAVGQATFLTTLVFGGDCGSPPIALGRHDRARWGGCASAADPHHKYADALVIQSWNMRKCLLPADSQQ